MCEEKAVYQYDAENDVLIRRPPHGADLILYRHELVWRRFFDADEGYRRAISLGQGHWDKLDTVSEEKAEQLLKEWGYSEQLQKEWDLMQEKWDLVRCRHSVRQFREKSIPQEVRDELDAFARQCSIAGELSIQIIYDEPRCFNSRKAHYGKFRNCSNYIALVGKNGEDLEERCGYYGEQVVLKAQELGLNTCWAALTHGKSEAIVAEDETEVILIALGYGQTQGRSRKSKSFSQVSDNTTNLPDWYIRGIRSALCAPTAMNQQKFKFSLNGDRVSVRTGRFGPCLRIDLGIVKYHFELLAGPENFTWA